MLDLFKPSEGPMKVRKQTQKIYFCCFVKVDRFFSRSGCNFNLMEEKEGESAKLVRSSVGSFRLSQNSKMPLLFL